MGLFFMEKVMKIYLVGGAVRDYLLGKLCNDKDYVVVGSTVEEMMVLGFQQVGKEFPVFLDKNGTEYALARTERKTGDKHTDFEFEFSSDITLEDDLVRRDFTVNAMAFDEDGNLIDYFKGQEDLKNKVLRAVRPETFIQDPLRVLRGCRFASQLDFEIEPSTMELFKQMVKDGMLEHLTPERVWKETSKALSKGYNSSKYFELLNECGALERLFPEIYALVNTPENPKYHPSENTFKHTMIALNRCKDETSYVKFPVLVHDLGKGNTPKDILPKHNGHDERGLPLIDSLCNRLRVPNDLKSVAKMFCNYHMRMGKLLSMNLRKQYDMIKDISSNFRNKEALDIFVKAFKCDWFGEEVSTAYNSEEELTSIVDKAWEVYDIMENISLGDLPEETQIRLKKYKGEEFGKQYRDEMINYLRYKLKRVD